MKNKNLIKKVKIYKDLYDKGRISRSPFNTLINSIGGENIRTEKGNLSIDFKGGNLVINKNGQAFVTPKHEMPTYYYLCDGNNYYIYQYKDNLTDQYFRFCYKLNKNRKPALFCKRMRSSPIFINWIWSEFSPTSRELKLMEKV
jgi:hypothetical protein